MDDFNPVPISNLLRVTHTHDGTVQVPGVDDINFMHWNINHLTNKLCELELHVASYPGLLHLIAISETWLTKDNHHTYITSYLVTLPSTTSDRRMVVELQFSFMIRYATQCLR